MHFNSVWYFFGGALTITCYTVISWSGLFILKIHINYKPNYSHIYIGDHIVMDLCIAPIRTLEPCTAQGIIMVRPGGRGVNNYCWINIFVLHCMPTIYIYILREKLF